MNKRMITITALVVALALPGALYAQATDPAAVAAAFYETSNAGDIDACVALFAENAVVDVGAFGVYTGPAEIRAWIGPQVAAHVHTDFEIQNVDGDKVSVADFYSSDEFDFVLEAVTEFVVQDGKIQSLVYTPTEETMAKVQVWMAALPEAGGDRTLTFGFVVIMLGGLAVLGGLCLELQRRVTHRLF